MRLLAATLLDCSTFLAWLLATRALFVGFQQSTSTQGHTPQHQPPSLCSELCVVLPSTASCYSPLPWWALLGRHLPVVSLPQARRTPMTGSPRDLPDVPVCMAPMPTALQAPAVNRPTTRGEARGSPWATPFEPHTRSKGQCCTPVQRTSQQVTPCLPLPPRRTRTGHVGPCV